MNELILRDGSTTSAPGFQPGGGGTHPTPSLHKSDYFVKPAALEHAKAMVVNEHYARGCSNTSVYTHGLFHHHTGELRGVALWLPPTRVAAESVNRENWKRVLSLTRLVCLPSAPKNSESFLIAHSVRMIRNEGEWVSLVTYADESQGHTGAIYLACGWEYVGRTGPYPRWVDASGKQVAALSTKTRTKAQMLALGHIMTGRFYKHKFVKHLRKRTLSVRFAA